MFNCLEKYKYISHNHKIVGNCQIIKSKMNCLGRHGYIKERLVHLDKDSTYNIYHHEQPKDANKTVN